MPSSTAAFALRTASSMQCLRSLSSTSVAAPALMTRNTAGQLGQTLLQLLTVVVGSLFSISWRICGPAGDGCSASPAPSTMVVSSLVTNLSGRCPAAQTGGLQGEADLFADDLATR